MKKNKTTHEKDSHLHEELLDAIKKMQKDIDEIKLNQKQVIIPYVLSYDPNICIDGGYHEYPNPWHATIPPFCKKCGKQMPDNSPIITFTTGSPMDFDQFGGNMMFSNNKDSEIN